MKQSRTWQLYCSEAEMSKEDFPWIKNIPNFSLNEKEREGKKMNKHYQICQKVTECSRDMEQDHTAGSAFRLPELSGVMVSMPVVMV